MTVNIENMKILVAALRSGVYEQAAGRLRSRQGGYCCLGVATDKAIKSGVQGIEWRRDEYDGWFARSETGDGAVYSECGVMPVRVASWLGLVEQNPSIDITPLIREAVLDRDAEHLLRTARLDQKTGEVTEVPRTEITVAELNDAEIPFSVIADILEEAYLGEGPA